MSANEASMQVRTEYESNALGLRTVLSIWHLKMVINLSETERET